MLRSRMFDLPPTTDEILQGLREPLWVIPGNDYNTSQNDDMKNKNEKLRFKIIGFTKKNGLDWDCEAIGAEGEKFLVDPFVGCAWKYEDRSHLLNCWFESEGCYHATGVFLPSEGTMRVIEMK